MVPKLRLSLFKDNKSSRWSLTNLGEIVEFKKGKGISKSDISKNGAYPCVRYGELYTIYNEKIDKVQSKTNCDPNEHVISKSGDILIPASGETAVDIARASSILRGDVILGGDINILTPKSNNLNSLFLSYSIIGKKKMELAKMAQGNSVVHLYSSQLKTLEIWIPLINEQTKIADFLSSVDEKITLLNKQYNLLYQYKKGMMQKIFNQELKFKDDNGKAFPKWNTLQLKDIAIRVTRKNKENNNTILTISGRDGLVDQMTYFNKQIASKNVTGYYLIRKGEFAYNKSYSQGYPMGAIKMLSNYEKGVVSTLYICFKLNDEQSCDFYQHYFESGLQNRAIEKVAQEGARNHGLLNIGVNDFFDIELQVPSLAEQNKIARFLSAIEDKIAIKRAELDMLKKWKQGLLQQMLV